MLALGALPLSLEGRGEYSDVGELRVLQAHVAQLVRDVGKLTICSDPIEEIRLCFVGHIREISISVLVDNLGKAGALYHERRLELVHDGEVPLDELLLVRFGQLLELVLREHHVPVEHVRQLVELAVGAVVHAAAIVDHRNHVAKEVGIQGQVVLK